MTRANGHFIKTFAFPFSLPPSLPIQCCFTSTETVRTIKGVHLDCGAALSLSLSLSIYIYKYPFVGQVLPVIGSKNVLSLYWITRTHPNHSGHVLPVVGSKPAGCQYGITLTHPNHSSVVYISLYISYLPLVQKPFAVSTGSQQHIGTHTATPLHAYTYILRPVDCRITRAKCTTKPRALQAHCNCSVQRTTERTSLMASPSQRDVRTPLHLAARSASINQSSPAAKWHSHWIMLIILANEC